MCVCVRYVDLADNNMEIFIFTEFLVRIKNVNH
jgi:hypothetical protein